MTRAPDPWSNLTPIDAAAFGASFSRSCFYVYVLCRPDRQPFYVGKGFGQRAFQHEAEARNTRRHSHKLNVIRHIWANGGTVGYALAGWFDHEVDAHAEERRLIGLFGRHDLRAGPLTNQTDGGEGASNPSEEARARHRASLGGEAEDPERRVANRFLASIGGPQASVPIKPWTTLRKRAELLLGPSPGKPLPSPRPRMAKAIVASAAANELLLRPGTDVPRAMTIDGLICAIEEGCGRDMIGAGIVEPVERVGAPLKQHLRLTKSGFDAIVRLLGRDTLLDLGVLEP